MKKYAFFKKGFTIVELIIVIVVIAILATVVIVGYNGISQSARDKALLSDIDVVESELAHYATKNNGIYSAALNWDSSVGANSNILFTPSAGNVIVVVGNGDTFCIKAYNPQSTNKTLSTAVTKGDCTVHWKSIATQYRHTCAISTSDQVYCWGQNTSGQLGNNTTTSQATPVLVAQGQIPQGVVIRQLSLGISSTCGIGSDDNAYCWGASVRLSSGSFVNSSTPVLFSRGSIPAGVAIKQVSNIGNHACILASNNAVYCKGQYSSGAAGDYGTNFSAVAQGAIPVGSTITQIADGQEHTCALTGAGVVYCWGANNYRQIGDGTSTSALNPTLVSQGNIPAGAVITKLAAGGHATCAVASSGKSYCWGYRNGTSQSSPLETPQGAIPAGASVREVSPYSNNSCQLMSNSKVYCWLNNTNGALGNGTNTTSTTPVVITGGDISPTEMITNLSVGDDYACVINSAGVAYCWGENGARQLGLGTTVDVTSPMRVKEP